MDYLERGGRVVMYLDGAIVGVGHVGNEVGDELCTRSPGRHPPLAEPRRHEDG
jgi:hypothetical protein